MPACEYRTDGNLHKIILDRVYSGCSLTETSCMRGVLFCFALWATWSMVVAARRPYSRIIGGTTVTSGMGSQYAHTVRISSPLNGGSRCTGSIIDSRHILSAAHCFRAINDAEQTDNVVTASQVVVYTGKSVSSPYSSHAVDEVYTSNTYSPQTTQTARVDIAVLKLATPIPLNNPSEASIVQMAAATDLYESMEGQTVYASGFGATVAPSNGGQAQSLATSLLFIQLPLVRLNPTCTDAASRMNTFVSPRSFCAGGLGGTDTCGGDSGGPLVFRPNTGPQILIGVTQAGTSVGDLAPQGIPVVPICGAINEYGIYTSVARNRAWIDSVIAGNEMPITATSSTSGTSTGGPGGLSTYTYVGIGIGAAVFLFMMIVMCCRKCAMKSSYRTAPVSTTTTQTRAYAQPTTAAAPPRAQPQVVVVQPAASMQPTYYAAQTAAPPHPTYAPQPQGYGQQPAAYPQQQVYNQQPGSPQVNTTPYY